MQYDPYEPLTARSSKLKYKTKNQSYRSIFSANYSPKDGDFKCLHCHNHVVQTPYLSGVQNRNHCPYCLWSKHVDLYQSGDRLAACKGRMRPVGLALKRSHKKYGVENSGELMLIHQCEECDKLSINRVAADDIPERLYEIYRDFHTLDAEHHLELKGSSIQPLGWQDAGVVERQLFGVTINTS
jgi:hypothetical protein